MNDEFKLGRGKISATISLFLSLLASGGVICFYFPGLSTPELRGFYPIEIFRVLIDALIILSSFFALVSLVLGYKAIFPLIALCVSLVAALLGGGSVKATVVNLNDYAIGLDWFLLDIFLLSLIFVPLEKIWPLKKEQKLFRQDLKTDIFYFCFNHLTFQALLFLSGIPAKMMEQYFGKWNVGKIVGDFSFLSQLLIVLFVLDLFQYFTHRAFHKYRFLWKFHAIHHSVVEMDWIAGSRLHIVDVIITRAIVFIPFHLAGFREDVLQIYALIAAFQTVFIHSNIKWRMDILNKIVATPSYHHWHHSSEKEALDKNFAVHLPLLDILFGTYFHPPGRWPEHYGLYKEKIPCSYLKQFWYPFQIKKGKS